MRRDKLAALRQKLRRGADAFEFGALIEGVSTLEESKTEAAPPTTFLTKTVVQRPVRPQPVEPEVEAAPVATALIEPVEPEPALELLPEPPAPALRAEPSLLTQAFKAVEAVFPPPAPPNPNLSLDIPEPIQPFGTRGLAHPVATRVTPSRLKGALEALSSRLFLDAGRFVQGVSLSDPRMAGESLASLNQVLELLLAIDPTGDVARQQGTHGAPPEGRTWPRPAWSTVEFMESPLSDLVPRASNPTFTRAMFAAAWGVRAA